MPGTIRYLTHPQVQISADTPVPLWSLNATGAGRVAALVANPGALMGTTRIISSAETKALETARPLAQALGLQVEIRPLMHENDRSSTGFLPPPEFEAMADAFFAQPEASMRGWETAKDAQSRILVELAECLKRPHTTPVDNFAGSPMENPVDCAVEKCALNEKSSFIGQFSSTEVGKYGVNLVDKPKDNATMGSPDLGDILIVGHGAVGTLLYCALLGLPISRRFDQAQGGGCWFQFDAQTQRPAQGWQPMERLMRA